MWPFDWSVLNQSQRSCALIVLWTKEELNHVCPFTQPIKTLSGNGLFPTVMLACTSTLLLRTLWAVYVWWTGLGTGLWDWTHRKLGSSFLKAKTREIAEWHYTAATIDNQLTKYAGFSNTAVTVCRGPTS